MYSKYYKILGNKMVILGNKMVILVLVKKYIENKYNFTNISF